MSRRALLAGLMAIPAATAFTACAPGKNNEPDPLNELLDSARHDLAVARAISGSPESVRQVIDVRQIHVEAIKDEIKRQSSLWEEPKDSHREKKLPQHPSIEYLRQSLAASAQQALDIVEHSSGYRAGLCGSIGASCAVLQSVVLQ